MRYWPFFTLIGLFACKEKSNTALAHDCSAVTFSAGQTSIQNAFYEVLNNEQIISITEERILGDSLGIAKLHVEDFHPEGSASTWEIELNQLAYSIDKSVLTAEWLDTDLYDASYSAFSLYTGEKLLDYTYDKLEVLFNEEGQKRYFGFYSNNGVPIDAYEQIQTKQTFGLFTYADQESQLTRVRLSAADPMWLDLLDVSNPVFELVPKTAGAIALNGGKSLYFTNASAAEKEGLNFDIRVIFYTTDSYKPIEFVLEVRKDELQIPADFEHSVFALESL